MTKYPRMLPKPPFVRDPYQTPEGVIIRVEPKHELVGESMTMYKGKLIKHKRPK